MGKGKSAVVEDLDDDLELMEDEVEPKAAKSKKNKTKAQPVEKVENTGMGASWLAEYVNEELGTDYTAAQMRVILRKMAAEGDLEREVGTDRARYQFTGEKDPIVRAVLKRAKAGEADTAKKERLAAAKNGSKKNVIEDESEDEAPVKKSPKKRKAVADDEEAPAKPVRRKRSAE